MFKKHDDWVEALAVVTTTLTEQPIEEIFSAGADGKLLRWQLDVEQNCDVYECIVSGACTMYVCMSAGSSVYGRTQYIPLGNYSTKAIRHTLLVCGGQR